MLHMRGTYKHLILVVLTGLLASPVLAAREKLELVQANEIRSFVRKGVTYRQLNGDVVLKRGDAVLSCEIAEFQVESDEARLEGQVKITTRTAVLSGNTARYYGNRDYVELLGDARYTDEPYLVMAEKLAYHTDIKKVIATDRPHLVDSASVLTADTIYYYENSKLGDARGGARMINSADSLSVSGDQLLYFSGKDSLLSYGQAHFKKWGSGDTTLQISSDTLSLEKGFFFAWSNVKLNKGSAEGTCGQAVYMQDDDVAIMKSNPVLKDEEFLLTGDVFNLHMRNGKLESVYVPENPHFTQNKTFEDTTLTDWLDGEVMAVEFEDDNPKTVTLIAMATSFFNIVEAGEFKGSNNVSGDTLIIQLADSSISEILVHGGAQGKFNPAPGSTDIEFPIDYSAEHIYYSIKTENTLLRNKAKIHYGDTDLISGQIGVYWRENLLQAKSLVDTLGAEDTPILRQAGQEDFRGKTMTYDLQTQRGRVNAGRTETDEGNYYGEKVTRVDEETFLMEEGYYTTCDLEEHPHFYFYSNQMKLITDRMIIARPVVLYIADIPLLALPFAVFPQKQDRTSGFILPSYDYRPSNGGRALKGFGYYWAINNYSDFKLTGDFYDQYEEFKFNGMLRYKKRYAFNGYVSGSMASNRTSLGEPTSWKWKLNFKHDQTVNPSLTIRANGNLTGDANFDRTYSHSQEQRLNTKLRSSLNINKNFESIKSNLSAGGTYSEDLQVARRVEAAPEAANISLSGPTLTAPSISFNKTIESLIENRAGEARWYHNIKWSYSNRLNNSTQWKYLSKINPDTSAVDSLIWEEDVQSTRSWTHNARLTTNTSLFEVMKLNGSLNYSDAWGFSFNEPVLDGSGRARLDPSGALMTVERNGFIRRGVFDLRAGINTKLYGIFPFRIGALRAVRHTLTPTVSLTYKPDFSETFWGYTEKLTDESDSLWLFDRFVGSDLGATPTRDALNMSYSLNNVFDYKLFQDNKETKGQFFTWDLSGTYDFRKDSIRASDISNRFKVKFGRNFQLSPNMTFEIYERDSSGTRKINQYRSPRLTQANVSFSFKLDGGPAGGLRKSYEPEYSDIQSDSLSVNEVLTERPAQAGTRSAVWSANFSLSYSFYQSNPLEDARQTFNLNTSFKFRLSNKWSITYNPSFNLLEQKIVSGRIGLTRDLHCWTLNMSYTPLYRWSGIYISIQPKASQLQDLKVEHRSKRRY